MLLKAKGRSAQLVSSLPFPSYQHLIKHSCENTELHFGLQPQPSPAAILPELRVTVTLVMVSARASRRLSWELRDAVEWEMNLESTSSILLVDVSASLALSDEGR